MRVKYIGDYYRVSLVNGKVYEVISIENGWYEIYDETDETAFYPPDMFEIVE